MKKKTFAIVLFLIVAVLSGLWAQFLIGPTALYNIPYQGGTELLGPYLSTDSIGPEDFTFGGDLRIGLSIFHLGAMALVTPGYDYYDTWGNYYEIPTFIDIHSRVGFQLKLLFLRVSLGVGPSFGAALSSSYEESASLLGGNALASVELVLGKLSLAVNYLATFDLDLSQSGEDIIVEGSEVGRIGVSVLFEL